MESIVTVDTVDKIYSRTSNVESIATGGATGKKVDSQTSNVESIVTGAIVEKVDS